MLRKVWLNITILLIVFVFSPILVFSKPITFDDLVKIKRLGEFSLSNDDKYIVYSLGEVSFEKNKTFYDLYLLNLKDGKVKQLTNTNEKSESSPQWSPDSKYVYYLNDGQIFRINVDTLSSEKITDFPLDIEGFYLSPTGNSALFTTTVYAECKGDVDCTLKKRSEEEKKVVKAQLIDKLLYRHWNFYYNGKYSHLFYIDLNSKKYHDVAPEDLEVPPFSLGGERDYDISSDGKEIAFVVNRDKELATSTNKDVILSAASSISHFNLTDSNKGFDAYPRYSPDGKYLAYRSQNTPKFESDLYRLKLYDRKNNEVYDLTTNFDNWVEEVVWSPDGKYLYYTADEAGYLPIYRIDISSFEKDHIVRREKVVDKMMCSNLNIAKNGNIYFASSSLSQPTEIYVFDSASKSVKRISTLNDELLSQIDLGESKSVWYKGVDRDIQAFLITPPNFNSGSKYPLLYLVHGGPQSAWNDSWSYRWNAQMFASRGYVVMMPNPTGSPGFGQEFVNDISHNWGGRIFDELMKGVDYAEKLPYVQAGNAGAAGASFGGYMMNWFEGHTDRFKAIASHDGVFNTISMAGSTEELWFTEWEFSGTYWESREIYDKWSPHNFVKNFKTPCLVIHGQLDYRVDLSEGLQLFTALQRMGVESKLLFFPDEGHWVLKPQNSKLWYETILDWFDAHLK